MRNMCHLGSQINDEKKEKNHIVRNSPNRKMFLKMCTK
jgi:hypothetical protein